MWSKERHNISRNQFEDSEHSFSIDKSPFCNNNDESIEHVHCSDSEGFPHKKKIEFFATNEEYDSGNICLSEKVQLSSHEEFSEYRSEMLLVEDVEEVENLSICSSSGFCDSKDNDDLKDLDIHNEEDEDFMSKINVMENIYLTILHFH